MLHEHFPPEVNPIQRVWVSMRSLRTFTKGDLMATAEARRKPVERYLQALVRFGYVRQVTAPTTGRPATYQLIVNLGPLAPDVGHRGHGPLLDPNVAAATAAPKPRPLAKPSPAVRLNVAPLVAAAQELLADAQEAKQRGDERTTKALASCAEDVLRRGLLLAAAMEDRAAELELRRAGQQGIKLQLRPLSKPPVYRQGRQVFLKSPGLLPTRQPWQVLGVVGGPLTQQGVAR